VIALFLHNLIILPIVLPLIAGAALLFIDERRRAVKMALSLAASALGILIAAALVYRAAAIAPLADVYNLGNWPAPFAIIFVLDRLSAALLLMAALISLAAGIYATAHWHKAGAHFYSFAQFFMVGINGAFLTGDIFNLFVFFEVMLTASYALLMHGSGLVRVRAGMQYVAVNLVASFLFLIGAALLYGGAGTLNMADLAAQISHLSGNNLLICRLGLIILGVAFLTKAAMWPLCFWAPAAYSAAAAPAGALLAITGKVGLYAILRLGLLLLSAGKSEFAACAEQILLYGGLLTLIFGFLGFLTSQSLPRMGAHASIISAGTVLAAMGLQAPALSGVIVYYLISSTFALAAFFLLAEPAERGRDTAANVLAVTMEVYGEDEEEEEDEVGFYIPATLAILGACFALCALLLIGMPPLSGFIAKFMMISGVFHPQGPAAAAAMPGFSGWLFIILLLLSGFAQLIAMARAGIRLFWALPEAEVPKVQITEILPIAALLGLCCLMALAAGPIMHYMAIMAAELHAPANYIHSVLGNAGEMGE